MRYFFTKFFMILFAHTIYALSLKIAKRKYINSEPVELLEGERVRWESIIRGNTWTNTLDELIDLERRTSRRKV